MKPSSLSHLHPFKKTCQQAYPSSARTCREFLKRIFRQAGSPYSEPGSPFWPPIPENWITSETDCKAKRTFASPKSTFAEEKPGESLPCLPRLPLREPCKSIAPTPVHPLSACVIRFAVFGVGRSACRKQQQRNPVRYLYSKKDREGP
jgi:hypothetical protein